MGIPAQIGQSIHIKGEVVAGEPLTIAGQVDGNVEVNGGALTLIGGARITGDVRADTVVVAGDVHGNLSAGARIIVNATATIEGDLAAPSVSLAEGARLQGSIQTAARGQSLRVVA